MKTTAILPLLFLTTLLFGCFNPTARVEKSNQEFLAKDNDEKKEMSLLWRIDGKRVKEPAYLFGTMHMIQKEYWLFPESLEKRISEADKIVMEIAGLPSPSEAMELVMLKEGTFFDFFNEAQLDSVYTFLEEKAGLKKEMVDLSFSKMKPFAVVQLATAQQFSGETESYELTIQNIAKKNGIELLGLETAREQMAIFDKLTKEEQTEMVMQTIKTFDEYDDEIDEMQTLYVRQRIDSLYLLIKNEAHKLGPTEAQLLDNRNQHWIPQIKDIVKKYKAFIAVGAAHLGGPEGVIALLRKEGYTLTPIKL